jgi:hypothetical protein
MDWWGNHAEGDGMDRDRVCRDHVASGSRI